MKDIEIKGKIVKTTLVLMLICSMFAGCKNAEKNNEETELNIETDEPESDTNEQSDREIRNEIIEDNSEIAEMITYDHRLSLSDDGSGNYNSISSLYIAGLKIFEEFGTKEFGYRNEGGVSIISNESTNENVLKFHITNSTGPMLASGSVAGPEVRFKMNLDTNEIIEKEFTPAPNYAEATERAPEYINPDSIQYSEKVNELSDERLIEIGLYFKKYIMEIEKSKKQ